MAELVVVGFKGKHRAAEVLDQLEVLDGFETIDLKDAVAVYRTDDGKLRVEKSTEPTTNEGAVSGALLGGMIGALLIAPFTGGLSAVAAAEAVGGLGALMGTTGAVLGAVEAQSLKNELGISDEFVNEVGGMVQPGESAVFVVAQASDPEAVVGQFRGYGGKVLRTTLPHDSATKFEKLMKPQSAIDNQIA